MRRVVTTAVLCGLLLGSAAQGEDSLSDVRSNARSSGSSSGSSSSNKSHAQSHHHCDDDDQGFFTELFGQVLFFAVMAPFAGPHGILEGEVSGEADLLPYPYAQDAPGYLSIQTSASNINTWGVRASTDFGSDFSGMDRIGGQFLIENSSRIGIDVEFSRYLEDTVTGTDSLWTGDTNLVFRFAQSERVQFHSGLGVAWLNDRFGTELGFNFTYGFTAFPKRPFIIDTTMDLGTLGEAGRFHIRSTAGVNWKALEIFTGYDYQSIGGADLHGPLVGLRLWF